MHPAHHTRAQRTLMIQGTTSDAGKSTLVAALCRMFARRGVQVAPFKPQNMALNSAVTPEGGEIGRAQAVQAQAAGIAPHTDMNPVLLKPNSDISAQVIIHGQAIGNMDAVGYHRYKEVAMPAVLAAHARLTQQYALVVVEGAGSPAEINLRERDIANMGFAEAVDCPVILIADIDRGGVFAHLVGTLALLSASEQQRVVGFVINRFRGDVSLLQPGLDWLQQHTGKPVLAVLPYLHGLHLQAEDALPQNDAAKSSARLTVIAPALPRISNHTDLDVLRLHPQVNFAFVAPNAAVPPADLIILPGSKSVRDDLTWLRQQGWDAALQRHLRYGGKLLGICGGMQMLGTLIDDPLGIEGTPGQTPGLGYVDLQTTLAAHKQLRQVTGELLLNSSRAALCGYEIHAGVSRGRALQQPLVQIGAQVDGCIAAEGQIIGTYLHGLFDTPAACAALLSWAGLNHASEFDYHAHNEAELNRLADAVASQLDWPLLQRALQPWLDDAVLCACCYDAALC